MENLNTFRIVKGRGLYSNLHSAFAWAIFTLGASQLALVLGGPIAFLVVMFCCGGLFAAFLFKVEEPASRSARQIAKTYLPAAGILLVANGFYVYITFLKLSLSDLIFLSLHILLFVIPFLIVVPFLRKSNVAK